MFIEADDTLFSRILANHNHVLNMYLPERSPSQYKLRTKVHNRELITKFSQLNDRDFIRGPFAV